MAKSSMQRFGNSFEVPELKLSRKNILHSPLQQVEEVLLVNSEPWSAIATGAILFIRNAVLSWPEMGRSDIKTVR
jgi:hypothetical protein